MSQERYKPEQIATVLRQIEVAMESAGKQYSGRTGQ
jgi:hypothetical protein